MAQPDIQKLASSLSDASTEIARLPNLPALDQAGRFAAQIDAMQRQMITHQNEVMAQLRQMRLEFQQDLRQLRTEMDGLRTAMNEGFERSSVRQDSMYVVRRYCIPMIIDIFTIGTRMQLHASSMPRSQTVTPRSNLSLTRAMRLYLIFHPRSAISQICDVRYLPSPLT